MSYPYVRFALAKAVKKGEDYHVSYPTCAWPEAGGFRKTPGPRTYGLYAVVDGHNGAFAAEFTANQLPSVFAAELLRALTVYDGQRDEAVAAALGATFLALDAAFAGLKQISGATLTVVIQLGWTVSVANIGDSRAILDTGHAEVRAAEPLTRRAVRVELRGLKGAHFNPTHARCCTAPPCSYCTCSPPAVTPRAFACARAVARGARWAVELCTALPLSLTLTRRAQILQLTFDFRLEDSADERARVLAGGGVLRRLAENGHGPCRPNEARPFGLHCSFAHARSHACLSRLATVLCASGPAGWPCRAPLATLTWAPQSSPPHSSSSCVCPKPP